MILLDTNVLSEFMRVAPEPDVVAWLDEQPSDQIWICAITRAEVELGIALLPARRLLQPSRNVPGPGIQAMTGDRRITQRREHTMKGRRRQQLVREGGVGCVAGKTGCSPRSAHRISSSAVMVRSTTSRANRMSTGCT